MSFQSSYDVNESIGSVSCTGLRKLKDDDFPFKIDTYGKYHVDRGYMIYNNIEDYDKGIVASFYDETKKIALFEAAVSLSVGVAALSAILFA